MFFTKIKSLAVKNIYNSLPSNYTLWPQLYWTENLLFIHASHDSKSCLIVFNMIRLHFMLIKPLLAMKKHMELGCRGGILLNNSRKPGHKTSHMLLFNLSTSVWTQLGHFVMLIVVLVKSSASIFILVKLFFAIFY